MLDARPLHASTRAELENTHADRIEGMEAFHAENISSHEETLAQHADWTEQSTYNNTFVINRATPADKKSYPKRSLIVMSALISVMSMALISLIVSESGILHYVKN